MRKRWIRWLLVLLLPALGCSAGFESPSQVLDLRILAVRVEPPEVVYPSDGMGVPEIDPATFSLPATRLTLLVADPVEPAAKFAYRVEGCVFTNGLVCDDDLPRVEFASGKAFPGTVDVDITIPLDLIMASFEADPFFGYFGVAVWLTGEIRRGDEIAPFVKAFILSPGYGFEGEKTRLSNRNPGITGLLTGEKEAETPIALDDEGRFSAAVGEKVRLLAQIPPEDRETYWVMTLALEMPDLSEGELPEGLDPGELTSLGEEKEITEELSVDFFGTCGRFAADWKSEELHLLFEKEEEKKEKDLGVDWTAPDEAGECYLWFVVSDGRGGIDWHSLTVSVE